MAAADGLQAMGLDGSSTAIEMARSLADERGLDVEFILGNALELPTVVPGPFDTVMDSALFHVFDDADRAAYVAGLSEVMAPGGRYLMLCFSDEVPGEVGPRRISETEIRKTFVDGWEVESLERTEMIVTEAAVPALAAVIHKPTNPRQEHHMEIEHSTEQRLSREEAAARLRALADELSSTNEVSFVREGKRFTVDVPAQVTFSLEVEVGGEGNEIEVELTW